MPKIYHGSCLPLIYEEMALEMYRKMMINQDTACMFASCYDNKGGHLPAHSANPAITQHVRVGTDFASFFSRERKGKMKLNSSFGIHGTWLTCMAGTAQVSNFIIITSSKHAAPVLVHHHLPVSSGAAHFEALRFGPK